MTEMGNEIDAYIASFRTGEQNRLQREADRQAEARAANVRRLELQHTAASIVRGYASELIKTVSERGYKPTPGAVIATGETTQYTYLGRGRGYVEREIRREKPILYIADVMYEVRHPYDYPSTYLVSDHCVYLGLSDGAILSSSNSTAPLSKAEDLPKGIHLATDDDIIPQGVLSENNDPNQQPKVMAYRSQLIKVGAYLLGQLPDPGFLSIHLPSQL